MGGIFVTFEGPDGSGKTTQVEKFVEHCRALGQSVVQTREPGGTLISEKIRSVILDADTPEMDDITEALLYAAARAQHVSQVIRPALAKGSLVICDRFVDSSIAYQGYGRGLGEGVVSINAFAVSGLMPDLTFFLDIKPEEGLRRITRSEGLDRLEKEALDFHERVYEGYHQIIKQNKERYRIVDASRSKDIVSGEIIRLFDEWIAARAAE